MSVEVGPYIDRCYAASVSLPCRLGIALALLTLSMGVGCAVGDTDGFTSGPANTVGNSATSGPPGDGSGPGGPTTTPGSGGCLPTAEVCDGIDNDCDGEIDNGDPEGGMPCQTEMPGECGEGTTVCQTGVVTCVPDSMGSPEICDGLDNDCNGMVDDGDPEAGEACSTGMPGVCADGTSICNLGVVECVPDAMASTEVCDGADNDCNGTIDDGNPGGGGACATGMSGICSAGTEECSAGQVVCTQNQAAAADETCGNMLDDDCNGMVDDLCAGGMCAHDLCLEGVLLDPTCDPCVATICALDAFCCSNSWDLLCVGAVTTECNIPCP